jgi:hypothetical protein
MLQTRGPRVGKLSDHTDGQPKAVNSTASADRELAIDRLILIADALKVAGLFRWNISRPGLAMTDRRATGQSHIPR